MNPILSYRIDSSMEIVKLKLKQDVLQRVNDYSNDSHKLINQQWLTECIDILVDSISLPLPPSEMTINPLHCYARVWSNRKGCQCTHKPVQKGYCQKHLDMIETHGVLRFGDIREPRPEYDLIKQSKEKLSWEDTDPLSKLNYVLQHQSKKVILATPHLIL